jgi:hypothetical protein
MSKKTSGKGIGTPTKDPPPSRKTEEAFEDIRIFEEWLHGSQNTVMRSRLLCKGEWKLGDVGDTLGGFTGSGRDDGDDCFLHTPMMPLAQV